MTATDIPPPATWKVLLSPGQRGPVLLISSGVGMHAFNDLSIAATIPVAYADLGALARLPLAYALFFIGVVTGGLISAALRARLGARRTGLAGATVFLTGVLLTALAGSGWVFALGRSLQGLSDGIIVALCYGMIPQLIRSDLVARVFSVEAVVWALAAGLGPLAGGYATELFGWRAAMLVCLPLVLVFLATVPAVLPRAGAEDPASRRPAGLPVVIALLGTLAFALPSALPGHGWAAVAIPLGLGLFALAFRTDRTRRTPFFPEGFFTPTPLGLAAWTNFLMPVAQAASSVFLALSLGAVFDLSPIWAGWILIALALSWSGTAMVVGTWSVATRTSVLRHGPFVQAAGLALTGLGLGTATLPLVVLGHALCGVAFGLVWGPVSEVVMRLTEETDRARVSSFLPTLQTTGFAVGAGLTGWIAGVSGLTERIGTETAPVLAVWGAAVVLALMAGGAARGVREAR